MSKDVENKAKDFFDSLKGIKGPGASEEIIKTLKTGFQGLNKSFDKAADSNTDSKTAKTTEDRERSNATLKRFTSIDNSLKALIKIESESLKLRKRAIDKNRFSVKKKLKNTSAVIQGKNSEKSTNGLLSMLGTGLKAFVDGVGSILDVVKTIAAVGLGAGLLRKLQNTFTKDKDKVKNKPKDQAKKKAARETAKKVAKQAARESAKEAAKKAAKKAADVAKAKALKEGGKHLLKKGGQELSKKAMQQGTKIVTEQLAKQGGRAVLRQLAMQGTRMAAQGLLTAGGSTAATIAFPVVATAATLYAAHKYNEGKNIGKGEQEKTNIFRTANPNKIPESGMFGKGSKNPKTLMQMSEDDMLTASRGGVQIGSGKEGKDGGRGLYHAMKATKNYETKKADADKRSKKIEIAKQTSLEDRDKEMGISFTKTGDQLAFEKNSANAQNSPSMTFDAIEISGGDAQDASSMGLSDNGLKFIFKREGFAPKPYWDHKQWSWGYGTKVPGSGTNPDVAPGGTISKEQASLEAQSRMSTYTNGVRTKFKGTTLTQSQFDAFTSFAYNLGPGKHLTNIASSFKSGGAHAAAERMMRYTFAGGKHNEGLAERRSLEANMLFAKHGMILNGKRPVVAGEAGPEAIIPLNNQGAEFMAAAMNKAMRITSAMNNTNGNSSREMKEYLNNQFIPKLAKAISQENKKISQNTNGNPQPINAFS